jgi:hypothetical protein
MFSGSVSAAATAALAVVTPPLLAEACAALVAGELDEPGLLLEVDDEPHADAAATHAIARTPIHALGSFMAKSRLGGRDGQEAGSLPPVTEVSLVTGSITLPLRGRQEIHHHNYDGPHDY